MFKYTKSIPQTVLLKCQVVVIADLGEGPFVI